MGETTYLSGEEHIVIPKVAGCYDITLLDQSNVEFGDVFGSVHAQGSSHFSADNFMCGSGFSVSQQASAETGNVVFSIGEVYGTAHVSMDTATNSSEIFAYGSSQISADSVMNHSYFYVTNDASAIIESGITTSDVVCHSSGKMVVFGSVDQTTFGLLGDSHVYLCDDKPDKLNPVNFMSMVSGILGVGGQLHYPGFLGGDQEELAHVCAMARETIDSNRADIGERNEAVQASFNHEGGAAARVPQAGFDDVLPEKLEEVAFPAMK